MLRPLLFVDFVLSYKYITVGTESLVKMCPKGGKRSQMESVQLKINEHMTSVGEEILCVLDEQRVTPNVRVFVLERLSAVGEFMYNLFQREIETLETLLEKQNKLLDEMLQPHIRLHRADSLHLPVFSLEVLHVPVCKEEVSSEEERSSSLVQEEPEPPHIKEEQEELLQRPEKVDRPMLTLLAVKSEDDDVENSDTEPVASTSTQHIKTQADVEDCGTSQPAGDDQLLSSHCSESDITEDSDEWQPSVDQSPLNTLKSRKTQHVEGQRLYLSNKMSRDLKPSKETNSMQSHTGKKGFSCTVCDKLFNQKGDLKRHMQTHKGEKPFTCETCAQGFSRLSSLKRHMMTHTGEKPFTCTVCNKGFHDNIGLKRHMRTHTGEYPFTCRVCSKGFCDSTNLKCHMRTHTGEKPFTCTVCSKGFCSNYNLKGHMMTHTGEKPFTCTVCNKGFRFRCNLRGHMKIHTGEKPFACTVCNKGFRFSSDLRRHMRTHTGEKPFTCTVCNKGFRFSGDLRRHMRTHTAGGNF